MLRLLHNSGFHEMDVLLTIADHYEKSVHPLCQSKQILHPVFPSRLLYNGLCHYRLERLKVQCLTVRSGEQQVSFILEGCSKCSGCALFDQMCGCQWQKRECAAGWEKPSYLRRWTQSFLASKRKLGFFCLLFV